MLATADGSTPPTNGQADRVAVTPERPSVSTEVPPVPREESPSALRLDVGAGGQDAGLLLGASGLQQSPSVVARGLVWAYPLLAVKGRHAGYPIGGAHVTATHARGAETIVSVGLALTRARSHQKREVSH